MRVADLEPGPPALRAAARGGRRHHRRRHRLRPRRRPLLPHGHHVGRRAARVVDARLARRLGPRRATSSTRPPSLGALNVAGPHARELLAEAVRGSARQGELPLPPPPADHRRRRPVPRDAPRLRRRAGVRAALPRVALRPAVERASSRPAREWDIRPFGLQAQRLLRLEKGHIIVSQDTDFETTPWKIGMELGGQARQARLRRQGGAAARQKRDDRELLVPWTMAAGTACPPEGATVTSTASSPAASRRRGTPPRSATRSASPGCTASTRPPARASSIGGAPASRVRRPRLLRPGGGEAPCLSSSRPRRGEGARASRRPRRLDGLATPAGVAARPHRPERGGVRRRARPAPTS